MLACVALLPVGFCTDGVHLESALDVQSDKSRTMAFVPFTSSSVNLYLQSHSVRVSSFYLPSLERPPTAARGRTRPIQLKRERAWTHTPLEQAIRLRKSHVSPPTTTSLLDDGLEEETRPLTNISSSSSAADSTDAAAAEVNNVDVAQPYRFEDPSTRVIRLQRELDDAVAAEEFANAAEIRDALREATNEDSVQVLSALVGYYDAFSSQNVDRLRRQWHDREGVVCQHPLTSAHVGYPSIINGYRTLFSTLPGDFSVSMSDVRISAYGDIAYATCIELPHSASLQVDMREDGITGEGIGGEGAGDSAGGGGSGGGGRQGQSRTKWHGLLATHIFEKVWDYRRQKFQYLLVHHSSSPIFKQAM